MTQEDSIRYQKALHAMQSGVKMMQNFEHPGEYIDDTAIEASDSPKHLRVGVNAAMSDEAALVLLLIDKGLFTLDDYQRAIADKMEDEVRNYEKLIREKMPGKANFKLM